MRAEIRYFDRDSGSYLLRTNWTGTDPKQLWKLYIQLTQAEDAFRTTKSDFSLRPVYHQTTERTTARILVCFLALAMWRTLQQWMECAGLGTAPRKTLRGDARAQITRCGAACEGQKDQTANGQRRPAGTEDTSSEIEAAVAERAKGY